MRSAVLPWYRATTKPRLLAVASTGLALWAAAATLHFAAPSAPELLARRTTTDEAFPAANYRPWRSDARAALTPCETWSASSAAYSDSGSDCRYELGPLQVSSGSSSSSTRGSGSSSTWVRLHGEDLGLGLIDCDPRYGSLSYAYEWSTGRHRYRCASDPLPDTNVTWTVVVEDRDAGSIAGVWRRQLRPRLRHAALCLAAGAFLLALDELRRDARERRRRAVTPTAASPYRSAARTDPRAAGSARWPRATLALAVSLAGAAIAASALWIAASPGARLFD